MWGPAASSQQSQHITLQYAKCYVTCSPRWILFIQFLPLLVNATTTPTNVSWEAGVGSNILSLKSSTIRSSHQISHSSYCWTFIDIHSRNKLPLTIWPHKKWSFTNIFIIHKLKLHWISVDISNVTFNSTVEFKSDNFTIKDRVKWDETNLLLEDPILHLTFIR